MIKKVSLLACIMLIALQVRVQAQEAATIPLVIDTDCATDDFMAISAILSSSDFKVLGIVCTDGGLSPQTGATAVRQLVKQAGLNIPVVAGVDLGQNPPWRKASEKIWGVVESPATKVGAYSDSLTRWFDGSKEEITYVCLGPISSLNRWVKKHGEVANLRRVIWFYGGGNTSYNPEVSGVDWKELQKLPINIHLVGQPTENYPKLTESLVAKITSIDVPLAKIMKQRFQSELLQHQLQAGHFVMWDEMIPVYLAFPSLFTVHPEEQNLRIADVHIEDTSMIADGFLKLFTAQGSALRGIVLEYFPVSPDVLSPDVAPYALEIQKRHGMEEWKLVVLTNEIHQHLGIYSIVGAKMGLFAREYFGVGLDKMKVQSKAGFYPPVGCLNDGLQISTGATLGRGDIEVLTTKPSLPSAIFICNGKKLEVTLKPEYSKQAAKDISDGIVKYGNLTNGYWNMVRELSIKYWLEWDRKKMFDYKEITQ